MLQPASSARHPFLSVILLLGLAVAGAIVCTMIAMLVGVALFGGMPDMTGNTAQSLAFLKIVQIFSTIGTFILPAIAFGALETGKPAEFLHVERHVPLFSALIAVVVIFSFAPLLDLFIRLNQQMSLPQALKPVENWMKSEERSMAELTKKLLTMKSGGSLAINLVMIAVLPALGEELFFRGCLQQTLQRWVRNPHVAVWLTAILFSAIHLQFYGFVPRMLLGAILGYLFVWGRNIWLPMLAHFTNNAVSVIAAFVYQSRGEPMDKGDIPGAQNWYVYMISAIFTLLLFYVFRRLHTPSTSLEQE